MRERYIASVSGGKDSTALYLWCIEQFGPAGFEAVFADTGHEAPGTYAYLETLPAMASGPDIVWVKADFAAKVEAKGHQATGIPFLDMARWKGRFPSSQARFCTQELKLKPFKSWLDANSDDRAVVRLVGVRAAESPSRAKLVEREFDDYFGCEIWRPLLRWSIEEVWAIHERHGIPPNPLYAQGFGRVGCFPCIYARKSELAILPEWAWEKLLEWETATGRTFFSPDKTPYPGLSTADQVRRWAKTSLGGYQLDMFPADDADVPHCVATWGACE